MNNIDLVSLYTDPIKKLGINYAITGSIASSAYGEPRLTHDIDLVLIISPLHLKSFTEAFRADNFYCPPPETILSEINHRSGGNFNIIHLGTGYKADIYLCGQDEFLLWAVENRKEIELFGVKEFIAPIEYVIIKKLEFFREGKSGKHISDIVGILSNSIESINIGLLDNYILKFGLTTEWNIVKEKYDYN